MAVRVLVISASTFEISFSRFGFFALKLVHDRDLSCEQLSFSGAGSSIGALHGSQSGDRCLGALYVVELWRGWCGWGMAAGFRSPVQRLVPSNRSRGSVWAQQLAIRLGPRAGP
jgi:hypothetical protein